MDRLQEGAQVKVATSSKAVAVSIVCLAVAGCLEGGQKQSQTPAAGSDGGTSTATSTNHAPTLSGTPGTSAKVGFAYSYQPVASDADGDRLTFSIANKPSWATFDANTGR